MRPEKELASLTRALYEPRHPEYEPLDRSTYCLYANDALRLMRLFQAQANEAKRLYDVALEKYHEMEG